MPANLDKIDTIVVLMLENRSFDHMLGYLRLKFSRPVDGLAGTEQNPDLDGTPIRVNPLASTVFPTDLGHSSADVKAQIKDGNQGFVANYMQQAKHDTAKMAMGYHDESHVWAYHRLAADFALCDRFHSSLPGPTIPNRLFAIAGHSDGDTDQPPLGVKIYTGIRTVFDALDAGLSARAKKDRWAYYFHDLPMLGLIEHHIKELLPIGSHRIRKIDDFYKRAAAGRLPAVSWIDPNFADVGSSNDDHPPKSDLYDGQALVKKVYDAIVGGGNSLFKRTLLVVTYDEHGGFYDHVSPPPSGDVAPFDRLGVRVPALVVSPWIPAGHVDSATRSHADVLKTILNRFAPGERLTPRVTNAGDLGDLLSLSTARSAFPPIVAPARPVTKTFKAPMPGGSDAFFEAYRTELERRGAVLDEPKALSVAKGAKAQARKVPAMARGFGDTARPVRVLAVHGIGNQDRSTAEWQPQWTKLFQDGIHRWTTRPVEVEFLEYDDIFAASPPSALDVFQAFLKLGWNGLASVASDAVGRTRGLGETPDLVRWTAGMIVQWIENAKLRAATRERLLEKLATGQKWDVVAAHSLGSLVCYDTFAAPEGRGAIKDSVFLTFGSQLGHLFVRGGFGGRIDPVECAFWYHVFNPHDIVFTNSLTVFGDRFREILLDVDLPGLIAEHDATAYLGAASVVSSAFRDVALGRGAETGTRGFSAVSRGVLRRRAVQRALLVGINDYPDPANRLEGCVNDVFLASAIFQELGFPAKDIRLLLDDRATTANLKERITWLLEDSRDGDQRILFYSGHGAQIPAYNAAEEADHTDECLVPYDFDWSTEHAITDNWFASLYAQLPYGVQFIAVLDCCHSGGMTRGGAKVRGLTPPDDIRHRALTWLNGRWQTRGFDAWNDHHAMPARLVRKGRDLNRYRLGCAKAARSVDRTRGAVTARRKRFGHVGPYLPILLQACQEDQLAYEYRDGTTSYGAFTYFLARELREDLSHKRRPTFEDLIERARDQVKALNPQEPLLVCPDDRRKERVGEPPDSGGGATRAQSRPSRKAGKAKAKRNQRGKVTQPRRGGRA